MKKSITIPTILQSVLTPEEVMLVVQAVGYVDNARKFTVYHLLQYWCAAASEEWSSYRFGADCAIRSGLPKGSLFLFFRQSFAGAVCCV